jgi:hypothetical protein
MGGVDLGWERGVAAFEDSDTLGGIRGRSETNRAPAVLDGSLVAARFTMSCPGTFCVDLVSSSLA